MSKVTLATIANLQNPTTAVTAINNNSAALTAAIDNTLSRDGTSPNTMSSSLDMNSHRIINLPTAVSGSEPIRKTEFDALGSSLTTSITAAVLAEIQPTVDEIADEVAHIDAEFSQSIQYDSSTNTYDALGREIRNGVPGTVPSAFTTVDQVSAKIVDESPLPYDSGSNTYNALGREIRNASPSTVSNGLTTVTQVTSMISSEALPLVGSVYNANAKRVTNSQDAAAPADLVTLSQMNAAIAGGGSSGVMGKVFPTMAAAQVATLDPTDAYLFLSGYAAGGDGGSAVWRIVVSEPSHTAKRVLSNGKWAELSELEPCPEMLGAFGNGVACDGALDDLTSYCIFYSLPITLNAGTYRRNTTWNFTSKVNIRGQGKLSTVITSAAAAEAIKFSVPSDWAGHELKGFGVAPTTTGGGTFGINIVLASGANYSYFDIDDVYTGFFGTAGFQCGNAVVDNNGLFNGTISNCLFDSGVNMLKIQDNVNVLGVTAHGPGSFTMVSSGGEMCVVDNCNITMSSGAYFQKFYHLTVTDTQFEHPQDYPNYTGGVSGYVEFNQCANTLFENCMISPQGNGAYTRPLASLAISGTPTGGLPLRASLENNVYHISGTSWHIYVVSISGRVDIKGINTFTQDDLTIDVTPLVSIGATDLRGWPIVVSSSLVNSWSAATPVTIYKEVDGGAVRISGTVSGGNISLPLLTLSTNYRPLAAQSFPICTAGSLGSMFISTAGVVTGGSLVNTSVSFDGILLETRS